VPVESARKIVGEQSKIDSYINEHHAIIDRYNNHRVTGRRGQDDQAVVRQDGVPGGDQDGGPWPVPWRGYGVVPYL
jgi:hypothetical protein